MINLLPFEEKENIIFEKKKNLITILWILLLFFLCCVTAILFLIQLYLGYKAESQKGVLAASKQGVERPGTQQFAEKINSINGDLTKLNSFYQNQIRFAEISEKISRMLPAGIYLSSLNLSLDNSSIIKVSLAGYSPTREKLFEFKQNLGADGAFKELTNWVKQTDIDFTTSFTISK